MEIKEEVFIQKFIEQLEGYNGIPALTMETEFRNLDIWDSLTGAAVQIMIGDDFNSSIPDDEFRSAKTIRDLYQKSLKYRN